MTTLHDGDLDRHRNENTALFTERHAVAQELATLEDVADSVATRRRVRMLRRRLDDLTTEIVQSNIGLVRSYTRRFGGAADAHTRADFESAGMLGLMRAVNSYDPERGTFGDLRFQAIRVHNAPH